MRNAGNSQCGHYMEYICICEYQFHCYEQKCAGQEVKKYSWHPGQSQTAMTPKEPIRLDGHPQQDDIDQSGYRQPFGHRSGSCQSQQLRHIFEKDANVGEGTALDEFFGSVGLPSERLHIRVAAHGDKFFAALVGAVPETLQ